MDWIQVRGARTHNLKNVNVDIPRDRLVVITGVSGSGKSSLAFDTLYADGQRRYVESLSAYARQFLNMMNKPEVESIEGLSPAISIEQKTASHNPRSTVGTVTEIYDYLRLLYARVGQPVCYSCGKPIRAQTVTQMVDQVLGMEEGTRIYVLAPIVRGRKGEHRELLEKVRAQGFIRARIDGEMTELDGGVPDLDGKRAHQVELVVDRLKVREDARNRLAESLETALRYGEGLSQVQVMDGPELLFSERFACPDCNVSYPDLEPRMFSFNNPHGACPTCDGLGAISSFDPQRVIPHRDWTLREGAIRPWDKRHSHFYFQMLEALGDHYGFDTETPFEDLTDEVQRVILYGSGGEKIRFSFESESGSAHYRDMPFEGVIPNLERRYRETESAAVREDLAKYITEEPCPDCGGARLRIEARNVLVGERPIHEVTADPVHRTLDFFRNLNLHGSRAQIAERILKEINDRLSFLVDVGLDYLTLDRSADTLSGGEAQRIRLASQIGAGLVGVMYVLDEPSIGLHPRDNGRLLGTLKHLRDLGNTVIVVEHDEEAIRAADHVVDMGPGAGTHGGEVVATGMPDEVARDEHSLTGAYLSRRQEIAVPDQRHLPAEDHAITVEGGRGNNLNDVNVDIPLGLFTCVTGVSGSGKSTLINETLAKGVSRELHGARAQPAPHDAIHGMQRIDKIVNIDQSAIGRTPRSNPATYTGVFTPIRELFAGTQEARTRGYKPGRFSFNVKGGRCEACQGEGVIKVEMHFLPDAFVPCDECEGKRYNRETLEVRYKGKNIHEVLEMTIEEGREFFDPVPAVANKLQTLMDAGLSYVKLGQSATTLSGGEAQRVKLARELSRRDTGRTLYILDEPTTGLHFHDIRQLLTVLHRLRDHGNTVIVIEHNLDVMKTADWIIDLGPEGGEGGGRIIATGTPEDVAREAQSHTGRYLAEVLSHHPAAKAVAR
ncbi:excinuclease ABC subunit UvrA [Thiohalorhabdus methylotrophus]|uniref:UvrABC system protein A n=1 Tax=Thiohalorhabdus methylotrophus TaxID=3242694 RepID=A0ABV4TTA7_9GAMM